MSLRHPRVGRHRRRKLNRRRVLGAGLVAISFLTSGAFFYNPEPLTYVNHFNYSRRMAGLYMLCTDSQLMAKAQAQADAMAASGVVAHSTDLAAGVPLGTSLVVENVGVGWSLIALHVAFLDSLAHAANIFDRRLTHMGVGITTVGTRKFLAMIAVSNFTYECNL